jgi:hypothetical protein
MKFVLANKAFFFIRQTIVDITETQEQKRKALTVM